ncbi:rab11 family-interacting protein 1 isoform X1 [Coregonus clupeaformis]|uniref:rab11 family-interacting protein 1 isoform X1 n=1 Tax=Coregonus clupeaformis TaxID=59861 RepID=UPI001E1C34B6|nr:rab11 family-interacting protein 1 isoform X1 [Coregonus clupeaformis]
MSLSDQSQQWYPTSVQVTVLQARSLRIKGKNGTNDAYAIMQVAKDKFSTSVVEKSVAPVWKEEATFELPLFHNGNAEKCTLHVHVMHRALVGPDKLLGHAVINLLELSEVTSRNKTEWHKLLDKAGKPDKDRGEVLVDIQFMKNNLTASMFDLSATDKPRSRLGKFKDKVRGKKKEGLSDSASAVVPSFTQVLTDSEGEGEGGADKGEKKKKNNLKSLFSPKSNLQRHGLSQSMSVLGPLPEKNSSLSGSRSSGLNVDSSEGKNKFKFLTHKRTGSSDSKASQGSLSLGRSKVPAPLAEQSNLCINGSHVYTEEPQSRSARTGSTFSLASSGRGSMEDLRRAQGRKSSSTSMDSLTALKQPSPWAEEEEEEEERFKMGEEMKRKEEQERKKLEEEEGMRKEEQEKRRIGEEEERLRFEEERIRIEEEKMRFEEEEKRRKEEQENRKRIEEENIRVEDESRMMEEEERKRRLKEEGEERVKKKEQEMSRLEEEIEEQERWEEEERMKREDSLRKEDERKMREVEEEEERVKEEEERIRREQAEDMQRREERERKMREEEERVKREQDRLRKEEERRMREEEERVRKAEEDDGLREEERRMREEEERVKQEQDRLRKEEERRMREEEERVRKAEEDDRLREEERRMREEEERVKQEQDRLRKEEERRMREEEERVRKAEEDDRLREEERRMREEEERVKREQDRLRKEEEERKIREEEERVRKADEEDRLREEHRRMREEEERVTREQDRLRKEEEERKIREEEEMLRREEEDDMQRKEEEQRKIREEEKIIKMLEEERLRKEEAERVRLEEERENEQERRRDKEQRELMEAKERFRVEEENMKKEELRQEERMREEEKRRNAQMEEEKESVPLEEVEKQMEQNSEAKATLCNNPFEEVSPTSSFDDTSSNNLFEESPMTSSTGPISCRINKGSAVKPRPSSWGNPSKPVISSNPFLSSSSPELESSMDSPRGDGETRDAIDPSTELMEKKVPTPLAPNKQRWARKDNWSSKAKSHCATPKLTKTKPTKPPPPLRRHSSTSLVGSWDDQGSVSGKDHSSVRQDKGPAPLPPDNQRWARKDNWPSKSNPDSANSTLTQIKPTKPHPPPRRNSATSMVGSEHDQHLNESVSQDDSSVRRDKRPAPLPPDRPNQAPSETQRDQSMTSVNQGHKDRVGASMSKVSQRVVQMITPLTSSSTATTEHISGGQSSSHHGNQAGESMPSAIGGLIVAKHNKGPAPSRPQHPPGKTMPKADVLDEQSNTDEHESSVEFEFDPNNPFAEDCRMEKSSGRGEEQSLTGERQESLDSHNQQSCTSTDADLGLFQKSVVGDTTELPTPDVLPAEDGSCPNKSTSAKRVRAPLPPVKKTSTFREEGTGKQSSGKLQSPGAPTSSKLSSGISVKTQSGGVGVALPCVTVAQPPCVPSPAPSSLPHPEPLKGSGGRRDCPPQTTSSVPGQKTLLHAGALPSIAEQCSGEEAGGSGDRPASSTRRPHPVKPLRSLENQPASDIQEGQAGKSTRILGGLQEKMKGKDTGVKGPYSQLTQEELISLVVKQQEQLSKRDDKIKELEQYIDNLLVRIIEEQPSILMSMNSLK